jgi:diguanylate cyclase (GGDEF)-like protein
LLDKLRSMVRRISPGDLITTGTHSRDFRISRAEYISVRVRTLAFLFAGLALLWIPIDVYLLSGSTLRDIIASRLAFSALLLLLGLWHSQCNRLHVARMRLFLFLLVPGLFYCVSRGLLNGDNAEQGVLIGYSFLPFLMVALLAVVPLTLLEGVSYLLLSGGFYIAGELLFGSLFTLRALGDLWLLSLLGLIALWVQTTQLHMLMRLYREATRDVLTGLVNRRVLFRWLEQELGGRAAGSDETPLSVLLFDLDLFKRVNDNYGHLTGDAVLQVFARVVLGVLPASALVGRYGGEEFLAILPGESVEAARRHAEAVRMACHDTRVKVVDSDETIQFTTSVGVAEWRSPEAGEALLSRVDQGLYQAKESGRDLVAVAG